jgi:hypothetical protein
MRSLKLLFCTAVTMALFSVAHAQNGLLKRMQQKAVNAVDRASDKIIEKKVDEAVYGKDSAPNNNASGNNGTAQGSGATNGGKNKPGNKGGEGLVTTPPDVKENLTSAENAFKGGNYGEARYAVQQAMLGVEMEIGQQILKSLPEAVAWLKKDAAADQVTSTGWGWVGLTIHREYEEGDKQLSVTVANNSAWMQAINLYFNNTGYAQTTGGQQNWKQTKIKGYRAVIEYDESSGYKLSVPLGQTSMVVYEGVNFTNEQELMKAANEIDIDRIKRLLGEK